MKPQVEIEYNKDFYNWALHNADLIRQKKFSDVDIEHFAEEIESMGRNNRRENNAARKAGGHFYGFLPQMQA